MSSQLQELRGTFRRVAYPGKGEGRRFIIASVEVTGERKADCPWCEGSNDGPCVCDRPEVVSVKGEADPSEFIQDLEYRFWGKWDKPNDFGKQFSFKQLKRDEPHSRVAVVGYLKTFATGIGPVYASQLWDAFGTDAVRVLRTDPDRAAMAIGIPAGRARDASQALNCDGQNEDLRLELVQLFDGRGFPKKLIDIVIKKWGLSAPQRIRRDPFTLLVNRLPGCGFARCDRLYVDLGLPPERLKRQFACIWKALKDDGDGHTWHPIETAMRAIAQGVSGLPEGKLNWQRAVRLGVRAGWLRVRKDDDGKWWIAESKKADNEASVAADMRRLMKGSNHGLCQSTAEAACGNGTDGSAVRTEGSTGGSTLAASRPSQFGSGEVLEKTQRADGCVLESGVDVCEACSSCTAEIAQWPNPDEIEGLDPGQREQLKVAFRGRVCILTGNPGTGKTTAAALVLKHMRRTVGAAWMMVCSPTNLASQRLQSVLAEFGVTDIPVATFHRTLGVQRNGHDGTGWGFFYNRSNPLPCKVLFVDEDSMRDIDISADLLAALRDGTLVLFLGDPDQLPPVGHGAPLRDGVAAGIPHGHLTKILRNSGSITEFCKAARAGQRPRPPIVINLPADLNWKHHEASSPALQKQILSSLLKPLSGFEIDGRKIDPIRETQILVALNEKGDLSRATLNTLTQSILNPFGATVDGNPFRVGDKVICGENCKLKRHKGDSDEFESDDGDDDDSREYVSNGEIGIVLEVQKRFSVVELPGDRVVRVPVAKSDQESNGDFDLAYAVTFHKSQGSQWPIVICLSDRAANRLGSRELWNTGGSRPQKLLVTIGELATIHRQCQRVALRERKTFLRELICDGK